MELEPSTQPDFKPERDPRPRMEQPLPVRLIAVNDVRSLTIAGLEEELDALYVGILGFERDVAAGPLVYRAENFRLHFDVVAESLVRRDDYRPVQIEVQNHFDIEHKLIEAELEYTRQRALTPGREGLVLTDAAGNWLEITQRRAVG